MNVLLKPINKLRKYTENDIRQEASLYLDGYSISAIHKITGIPQSTISWHLIHPLMTIDHIKWLAIRYRLLGRAKDINRRDHEEFMINNSGLSEELYHQWDAIDEERRNK